MKRIMLSAAAIMFITGAFAGTKKDVDLSSSTIQLKTLSQDFPGIASTIPASVKVDKTLRLQTDIEDDDPSTYQVILYGKHYTENAFYNANAKLISYTEEIKDPELPKAVTDAIMQKHSTDVITKDTELIKDKEGTTAKLYKIYFKDGRKHYTAVVSSDGTIDHLHRQLI